MAKTLKIVDAGGEFPTVNFLAPGSGFRLSDNGLKGAMLEADQILAESGMASEVVDALTVSAFAASHDDASSKLQGLFNMLRKAAHFDLANWQKAPVYWQDQHVTETGARFARILRAQKFGQTSFWAKRFEAANIIAEQALDIVREHPWRDTAPGVLPTALGLLDDTEKVLNGGFETAGGGGADIWANWNENADTGTLVNETTLVHSGADAAKMTAGDVVGNTYAWALITVTPGATHQLTFWTRGDGTNAGRYRLYDHTNSAEMSGGATTTGVTGTTYTEVSIPFTAPAGCVAVRVYGYAPGANGGIAYFDDVSVKAVKTRIHVPGAQHASPATHLYNYDLSLTAFSANQIAANGITLFSVAGSVPAVGDIVYIGWNVRPGNEFVLPIATALAATGLTVVPEAYISGAWTALTPGTQINCLPDPGTNYGSVFGSIGEWLLSIAPGFYWQTVAINSVTAYWVRLRITALTTWTTTPVTHASETCYTPQKPYFTIPSTAIKGDAPPRALFRMYAGKGGGTTPGMGTLSRVLFGAKKASVTAFDSQLQLHQYGLPAGWARTLGTDAAEEANPRCSEGYCVGVSFATDATMKVRDTLVGTSLWDDYEGLYNVFLIAEQVGGANADMKVKARFFLGSGASGDSYVETDIAYLGTHDAGYEVVDLGSIRIPFGDAAFVDTMTADIAIQVFAQRVSGASTLRLSRIVMIPTDVWYGWVDDDATRDVNGGGTTLKDLAYVDMDMDVLLNRTGKFTKVGANYIPIYAWHRSSAGATLKPATAYRIYMLPMHYPTTFGTGPFANTAGSMVSIEAYVHNSYLTLRGAG